MREYFTATSGRGEAFFEHTREVIRRTEAVLAGENISSSFVRDVSVLGAIFHGIGIPASLEKYDSTDPEYQHQEGPPIIRRILAELGVRTDIPERVCYIVGNHHSRDAVDGVDFQIGYEADYLVNTATEIADGSGSRDEDTLARSMEEYFVTSTGSRLLKELFRRGRR
jgi:hypothetical protein